jgi:hypothetical protein
MSIGNGDDGDDIEDKLDELIGEISDLTRLLENAMMAEGEGAPEDQEETPSDMWEIGDETTPVDSVDQYKKFRRRAANNSTMTTPYFSQDAFDNRLEKLEARVDLFMEGYDSLESVSSRLGDDDFNEFIRIFTERQLRGREDVLGEYASPLARIAKPSAGFYGIRVLNGGISHSTGRSVLKLYIAGGDHYAFNSNPESALGIQLDEEGVIASIGEMRVTELNKRLARHVYKTNPEELPSGYVELLKQDQRADWREKYGSD